MVQLCAHSSKNETWNHHRTQQSHSSVFQENWKWGLEWLSVLLRSWQHHPREVNCGSPPRDERVTNRGPSVLWSITWPQKGRNDPPAPTGNEPRGHEPDTEGRTWGPHSHEVPESSDSQTQRADDGAGGAGEGLCVTGQGLRWGGMERSGAGQGDICPAV